MKLHSAKFKRNNHSNPFLYVYTYIFNIVLNIIKQTIHRNIIILVNTQHCFNYHINSDIILSK